MQQLFAALSAATHRRLLEPLSDVLLLMKLSLCKQLCRTVNLIVTMSQVCCHPMHCRSQDDAVYIMCSSYLAQEVSFVILYAWLLHMLQVMQDKPEV